MDIKTVLAPGGVPCQGPPRSIAPFFHPIFSNRPSDSSVSVLSSTNLRQRAALVLLLYHQPFLSNPQAGAQVQLHPNSVRLWRRRWADGHFSVEDETGRGCKPRFSPSG